MSSRRRPTSPHSQDFVPRLLLFGFLLVLALMGGASRPDALGQPFARVAAFLLLAILTLVRGDPAAYRDRDPQPLIFVIIAAAGVAIQLIPLPPTWWTALPGRIPFADSARIAHFTQPWRPLSLVPDAGLNSLQSLVVPAAALLAMIRVQRRHWPQVRTALLALIGLSALLGVCQLLGVLLDNPFMNEDAGMASGIFANRNHQALLMASGIVLVPGWVIERRYGAIAGLAFIGGLLLFLILMILATGSRTGLLLGGIAVLLTLLINARDLQISLKRIGSRWRWVVAGSIVLAVITCAVLAVHLDRAAAFNRLFSLGAADDMRVRALPVLASMTKTYGIWGAGYGSFDAVFRVAEPMSLLKATYFNHAHNDVIEIVIDGGISGVALLVWAAIWWVARTVRALGLADQEARGWALQGAGVMLLVGMASVSDYPARTPTVMAILAIGAVWLGGGARKQGVPVRGDGALPSTHPTV